MDNPICCSIDEKTSDQGRPASTSTTVSCTKASEKVNFDYSVFDTRLNDKLIRNNMMNKHRWMIPYCTIAAVFIACGALFGMVAIYVELCQANSLLMANRELIHAQDLKLMNHSVTMEQMRRSVEGPSARRQAAPQTAASATGESPASMPTGNVYYHWGVDDCPNTSSLIYSGIAASGSSLTVNKGSGSNILCMVSEPEYGMIVAGQQDSRARIFSLEYRNGNDFGDQSDLHGHDVPCAACMTTAGRQAILMVPGKASCPDSWTREYSGILMAGRNNNVRTSYICVDSAAESRPGTMGEDNNASMMFPVEGVCGTGGGLPCGPYVEGNELQCVVCSK